ncbi:hypothetical protein LOC67_13760 [Stieleria sp. JC731]|uniref:GAP1-N2 domain-containing protein n=1 Tax=Pirellulaceae TaxID=2691357 RepID=UPI001E28A36E|nr:hypothetical protein [Stieleria sp. JC731]MCC9601619.1 hypothetical protein [Stieleria sp. JC731]
MSSELLYTSAPQGLRHGAKGFCTVLSTAGMPINVISKLESISGYRQFYMADHPRYQENPIAFSHQVYSIAGKPTSVLSRIGPYGIDYTGRPSNKIAHHVVLEPHEMPSAGPAWLLQQPIIRSEWLGICETPTAGPSIPRSNQSPRICTTWKNVAGDSGWGGVIAEAFTSNDQSPLWVVYSIEQRDILLELIDEAIALLPVERRWQATFSTFGVKLPPDANCKLRFVPIGTDEAKNAIGGNRCINLTKSPSIKTVSPWVELARGTAKPAIASPIDRSVEETDSSEPLQINANWQHEDENDVGPPPSMEPPALPPGIDDHRRSNKTRWLAAALIAFLMLAVTTWFIATQFSPAKPPAFAPPIDIAVEEPVSDQQTEPVESPPVVVPDETPKTILTLRYDKKQLFAWILNEVGESNEPPRIVSARGGVRIQIEPKTERDSPSTDQPPAATPKVITVSWGADAFSLQEPAPYEIEQTELVDDRRTVDARKLRKIPSQLNGSDFYWHDESGYFIGNAKIELGEAPFAKDLQASAYREFGQSLNDLIQTVESIRENGEQIPPTFDTLISSFLVRMNRSKETQLNYLFRSIPTNDDFVEETSLLRKRLQSKAEELANPLERDEQKALLNIVSACGEIPLLVNRVRKAHQTLKDGCWVDVPDLIFFDAGRSIIRRIPLRIHFSW